MEKYYPLAFKIVCLFATVVILMDMFVWRPA